MNALLVAVLLARTLTLEEALDTARKNQPVLKQAEADARAAQARVTQARAPLLPQVNASLRYNLTTSNIVPQPGIVNQAMMTSDAGVAASPLSNFTSGSLTVSQLIWDFGQTWNRFNAAEANAEAAGQDARTRLDNVLFGVRSTFFSALAAKELLAVAKETLANQERHFGQIQGFVEVGSRAAIDLAQAKTDRANARVQLISAQNGYASARAALNQAMGIVGPADFDVSNDRLGHLPEEDRPLEEIVDVALKNRPELEALNDRAHAQEEMLAAARGAYGPSLSINAGVTGGGRDQVITGNVTVIGVGLTWNLFNGLGDWARVQEADANLTSLRAQVEALRQQVRLEIEQAQLGVHGAAESLVAADEALQAARDRLRLAEGRYETGVGNIIELGDAQLSLTNAAAQKVKAEFDLSAARAQLLAKLGQP